MSAASRIFCVLLLLIASAAAGSCGGAVPDIRDAKNTGGGQDRGGGVTDDICSGDLDCDEGFVCNGGRCIPDPALNPGGDAGPQTGNPGDGPEAPEAGGGDQAQPDETGVADQSADAGAEDQTPAKPAKIQTDVTALDFGELEAGKRLEKPLQIRNAGEAGSILKIDSIVIEGPGKDDFEARPERPVPPGDVSAGGRLEVMVAFAPKTSGAKSAELVINNSDPAAKTLKIKLGGAMKEPAAKLELSPAALDFGVAAVGKTSAAQKLKISNTGGKDAQLESAIIDPAGLFALTPPPAFPAKIGKGEFIELTLTFGPKAAGTAAATLKLKTSAAGHENLEVPLKGTGEVVDAGEPIAAIAINGKPAGKHKMDMGQAVTLDGSASKDVDADGSIKSYEWSVTQQPAGANARISGTGAKVSFNPAQPGKYTVQLVVEDSSGKKSSIPAKVEIDVFASDTVTLTLTWEGGKRAANDPLRCVPDLISDASCNDPVKRKERTVTNDRRDVDVILQTPGGNCSEPRDGKGVPENTNLKSCGLADYGFPVWKSLSKNTAFDEFHEPEQIEYTDAPQNDREEIYRIELRFVDDRDCCGMTTLLGDRCGDCTRAGTTATLIIAINGKEVSKKTYPFPKAGDSAPAGVLKRFFGGWKYEP
ncbi:MAG: hypothetical protein GMKNLPBB_00534 [Myxococcota bacterium]|nr:hypothetical protein [Myxococcota bacterium]